MWISRECASIRPDAWDLMGLCVSYRHFPYTSAHYIPAHCHLLVMQVLVFPHGKITTTWLISDWLPTDRHQPRSLRCTYEYGPTFTFTCSIDYRATVTIKFCWQLLRQCTKTLSIECCSETSINLVFMFHCYFASSFLIHCRCLLYNQLYFLCYISFCRRCVCHMFNKVLTYLLT